MRYNIFLSVEVDARDDREAYQKAKKMKELLGSPLVKIAVQNEGVELSGDPVVYFPMRKS